MSILLPEELTRARKLMYQARFGEALEITESFEKNKMLSAEDQVSVLLIKSIKRKVGNRVQSIEQNVKHNGRDHNENSYYSTDKISELGGGLRLSYVPSASDG